MEDVTVEKVVVYLTQNDRLLVFRHTQYPEAGIQVPAGTVKPGENLTDAAFRESREETGLDEHEMILHNKLGSDTIHAGDTPGAPTIHRHFFHLEFVGNSPATWIHYENDPSDGSPAPIEFEFTWLKVPEEIPILAGKQGKMLSRLNLSR